MSFLETWQKKQMGNKLDTNRVSAADKNVIVIGGGDTGCDCIATSLRQVRFLKIVLSLAFVEKMFIYIFMIRYLKIIFVLGCKIHYNF